MNQGIYVSTKGTEQREKLVSAGSLHWIHWLVISLSIILTVGAWYFSKQQLEQKIEAQFLREASQTVELVKERMELYENALWGGVALVDSNGGDINYDQWLAYSNSLRIDESYPGINGIGVIFNIQPNQLETYLAKEVARRPDYKMHPTHNESEYWPITYVEPAAPNKKAIGLDMAFEANRYGGIKKSRDAGAAQLTGPITLIQDAKKTPGFLFYTPFYKDGNKPKTVDERRRDIVGVTYAPFIMHKLMQGTLASQKRHVGVKISDGDDILYEDDSDKDESPLFSNKVGVEMYGRVWDFDIRSNLSFRQASSNNQPLMILVGGVVIDSLLLALFVFLTKANRRALSYADQMTEELKVESEKLEQSNEELSDFAYVASHDLKSPLRGIDQLAIWISEDIDNKEETIGHLKMMRNRVSRMESLLDDLLDYSKVGRVEDKFKSIDTKKVLESVYELMSPPEDFSLELDGSFPVFNTVNAAFQMVFRNLINNAIKHHDREGGKLVISVEENAKFYIFRLQDDGPGIEPKYHEKIFGLYQTLKSKDEMEGSGMGLAIIKKTVMHYSGDISVESREGLGACFVVNWPKEISVESES